MSDPFHHQIFLANRRDKAFLGSPTRFRAECLTCGWVSEWRPSEGQAESEGQGHTQWADAEPEEAA